MLQRTWMTQKVTFVVQKYSMLRYCRAYSSSFKSEEVGSGIIDQTRTLINPFYSIVVKNDQLYKLLFLLYECLFIMLWNILNTPNSHCIEENML